MSAAAHESIHRLTDGHWRVISEFEKPEGCVTCLSVLVPDPAA